MLYLYCVLPVSPTKLCAVLQSVCSAQKVLSYRVRISNSLFYRHSVCGTEVLCWLHQVWSVVCCRCVLPVGQLELLPGCEGVPEGIPTTAQLRPRSMALDGAALENLEVRKQWALCSLERCVTDVEFQGVYHVKVCTTFF